MAAAGAVAAAIANAIKASGVVVKLEPTDFETIVRKAEKPLIIFNEGGLFSSKYQYMTSYKGFAFFTKSRVPMALPSNAEMVVTRKIWLP